MLGSGVAGSAGADRGHASLWQAPSTAAATPAARMVMSLRRRVTAPSSATEVTIAGLAAIPQHRFTMRDIRSTKKVSHPRGESFLAIPAIPPYCWCSATTWPTGATSEASDAPPWESKNPRPEDEGNDSTLPRYHLRLWAAMRRATPSRNSCNGCLTARLLLLCSASTPEHFRSSNSEASSRHDSIRHLHSHRLAPTAGSLRKRK